MELFTWTSRKGSALKACRAGNENWSCAPADITPDAHWSQPDMHWLSCSVLPLQQEAPSLKHKDARNKGSSLCSTLTQSLQNWMPKSISPEAVLQRSTYEDTQGLWVIMQLPSRWRPTSVTVKAHRRCGLNMTWPSGRWWLQRGCIGKPRAISFARSASWGPPYTHMLHSKHCSCTCHRHCPLSSHLNTLCKLRQLSGLLHWHKFGWVKQKFPPDTGGTDIYQSKVAWAIGQTKGKGLHHRSVKQGMEDSISVR